MKNKFVPVLILSLIILLVSPIISLAWLTDSGMNANISATAHIHKSYFESGDGSAGSYVPGQSVGPFEIKTAVQLYYLAWLQELGYFNIDNDKDGEIDTVYFYLSSDLDMDGFTLPSIGTKKYPFVGSFDGQGHIIKNLTVTTNNASMNDSPESDLEGVEIVGFFGVIGSLTCDDQGNPGTVNGNVDGVLKTGYTYDSSENTARNFSLQNVTIVTEEQNSLIGVAAGYVNGVVANVAIASSSVNISSNTVKLSDFDNVSDYAIVGHCTDKYIGALDVEYVEAYQLVERKYQFTASDSGSAWGSSINMVTLLRRIQAAQREDLGAGTNTLPESAKYITEQMFEVDEVTGNKTVLSTNYSQYKFYQNLDFFYSENAGSYFIHEATSNPPHLYACGQNVLQTPKTVTTVTRKAAKDAGGNITGYQTTDAYTFSVGNDYLGLNADKTALASVTSENAVKWVMQDNKLFAETELGPYYLNATGENYTLDISGTTNWTYSNNKLSYSYNGTTYCLTYDNGWKIIPDFYLIGDGNGNYLSVNGTNRTSFTNTTDVNQATRWTFSDSANKSGYISADYNGTTVYLRNRSNALAITTDTDKRTSWSNSNGALNNGGYYVIYDNGWSLSQTRDYILSDGNGHYLNATTSEISVGQDANTATRWRLSNTGNNVSTTIYFSYNGQRYYLRHANNALSVNTTNDNNSWTKNNNTFYYTSGQNTHRLYYNNTNWTISQTNTTTFSLDDGGVIQTLTNITRTKTTAEVRERKIETLPSGVVSYFPLTVIGTKEDFDSYKGDETLLNVADGNTGYLVGGYYASDGTRYGDVRISAYAISSINGSYTPAGGITKIYTIKGNTSADHNTVIYDSTNSKVTAYKDYEKFESSFELLQTMLEDGGNNVYGIHFMNSAITKDHYVTAKKAVINGTTYTDYQLPENCIDFNLKEKGYINFFGGTYYGGKDEGFFSIHQIFRDSNNDISEIKQITKVYKYTGDDPNAIFIYQYSDRTFSKDHNNNTFANETAVKNAGYELAFDLEWIGNRKNYFSSGTSEIPNNRIYYFEIPANVGEYALGSVEGANGAYLMYLDISASKQTVDRIQSVEKFETNTGTISYPLGVQFTDGNVATADVDATNSAGFTINGTGLYTFTRSQNAITTGITNGLSVNFAGSSVTVPTGLPNTMTVSPKNPVSNVETVWRIIDEDNNQTSKTITRQVTTLTKKNGSNSLDVETKVYLIGETTETHICTITYTCSSKDALVNLNYVYTPASSTYSAGLFIASANAVTNGKITLVASGYTAKINGVDATTTGATFTVTGSYIDSKTATEKIIPIEPASNANKQIILHYFKPSGDTVKNEFALPVVTDNRNDQSMIITNSKDVKTLTVTKVTYESVTVTVTEGTTDICAFCDAPATGNLSVSDGLIADTENSNATVTVP